MKTIGDRVREIREARKPAMSQTRLGELVGMDADRINKIEHNTRGVGALEIDRIANALGVRTESLMRDSQFHLRGGDLTDPAVERSLGRLDKFAENWLTAQALLWVHDHSA